MRHKCQLFLLAGLGLSGCEAEGVRSYVHRVESQRTHDTYQITVVVPDAPPQSPSGYPAIYLLDGDTLLGQVRQSFVDLQRNGTIPPSALVAIGYAGDNHRQRDYTPTMADGPEFGGGDAFLEFLRGELFPFVASSYPISGERNQRCYIGHSLGGLGVLYAFFRYNELFYGYGAASPSLYYDNGLVLALEQQATAAASRPTGSVFVGVGTLDTPSLISAPSIALGKRLQTWSVPGFRFAEEVYYATSHTGTPRPTFERAVAMCLEGAK